MTEVTWNGIRDRLETWPGPRIADWQMAEWVQAFDDPGRVADALVEIFREQETDRWRQPVRPTIRDVRAILDPYRGPDDARNSEPPRGPAMSFEEFREKDPDGARQLIENLKAIGSAPQHPRTVQLRRQQEAIRRADARRKEVEAEVRADGLSGDDAREAAYAALARDAYAAMGLDYEASQAKGRPIKTVGD